MLIDKNIQLKVNLPLNKSIFNRYLILSYLYNHKNLPIVKEDYPDDIKLLNQILIDDIPEICDCDNAGTALRFLLSVVSIQKENTILTGNSRMMLRPIDGLVNALEELGAKIEFIKNTNYPPIKVLKTISLKDINNIPNSIKINDTKSSQFVSSIMMIAPKFNKEFVIDFNDNIGSFEYIKMTSKLMNSIGLKNKITKNKIRILPIKNPLNFDEKLIENDWSAASFFYTILLAYKQGNITLENLNKNSIQGDKAIMDIMLNFGIKSIQSGNNIIISKDEKTILKDVIKIDVSNCPDLAPPIAVSSVISNIETYIYGIENLKYKESDRIFSICNNIKKLNFKVEKKDNFIHIYKNENKNVWNELKEKNIIIETENDHRIAMAFAVFENLFENIKLDDKKCVSKSFPNFFNFVI
ncbi:MAG: hypothetical protein ACOX4D_08245 [Bacteroidales bacterium]|jgi:3-phosphoshikimate 1-carboxyvinyltransferase